MTGEPAHYEYGASSAKRWTSCSASVALSAGLASVDSEWGEEGAWAHWILEQHLANGWREVKVPVNAPVDMQRSIQRCVDYVFSIIDANPGAILSVENKLRVHSRVVPGRMGGTYDARVYCPIDQHVYIIDYKHGAGIHVSEENNLQMKMYALASLQNMQEPVSRVTVAIVQPRSWEAGGGVRPKEIENLGELVSFFAWLEERAAATLVPNPAFAPTEDNCRWCSAGGYGRCPVVKQKALAVLSPGANSFQDVVDNGLPDPRKMDAATLGFIMANQKLIKAFLKNVEMTATHLARQNVDIPGQKLVLPRADRAWFGDREEIIATLILLTGKTRDDICPPTMIGVTEAQSLVVDYMRAMMPGATVKESSRLANEALAMLTLKVSSGQPRLASISDPRPRIETSVPFIAGALNLEGLK